VEVERSHPEKLLPEEFGLGSLPRSDEHQVSRETPQSPGIARTEFHSPLEGIARAGEVPVVLKEDEPEDCVGRTETLVERERPLSGVARSRVVVERAASRDIVKSCGSGPDQAASFSFSSRSC
jgi:hypothetical protein